MPFLTRDIEGEIGVSGTGSTDNGVLVRDVEGELCIMPTNSEPGIYSYMLNIVNPAVITSPAQSTWLTAQTHNLTAAEKSNLTCSSGDGIRTFMRRGPADGSCFRIRAKSNPGIGVQNVTIYTRVLIYGTVGETSDQLLCTLHDAGAAAWGDDDSEIRLTTGIQTGTWTIRPILFGVASAGNESQIDYIKYQYYTVGGYEIDAYIAAQYIYISRAFTSYNDVYDSGE